MSTRWQRRSCVLAFLCVLAGTTHAQSATPAATPAPEPQLSPKAAYDDAMHPLDETRRSIGNWSAAELSALTVTLSRARAACQARNPHSYAGGADLIDLARLCALGQEWGTVVLATSLYIDEDAPAKPQLAEAHAARVDADLHLRSEPDAVRDTRAMLAAVPYSAIVAEASTEAIEYMRFSSPEDAIALATERQPFLVKELQRLRDSSDAAATSGRNSTLAGSSSSAGMAVFGQGSQSVHELYSQGLAMGTLLQQANRATLAQAAVEELDKALPGALRADDALRIADERRRYGLFGKPLPALTLNRSLSMPNAIPNIPAVKTVTALLLFPDWCTQCITSIAQLPETVAAVEGHSVYYYGLLAETVPEKAPPAKASGAELLSEFQPGYAAALLAEKPVLTVPAATTTQFAASDFPFLLITDVKGIVRVAQPVDSDDLNSGGKVDAAVLLVSKHWPLPGLAVPARVPPESGKAAARPSTRN